MLTSYQPLYCLLQPTDEWGDWPDDWSVEDPDVKTNGVSNGFFQPQIPTSQITQADQHIQVIHIGELVLAQCSY